VVAWLRSSKFASFREFRARAEGAAPSSGLSCKRPTPGRFHVIAIDDMLIPVNSTPKILGHLPTVTEPEHAEGAKIIFSPIR
jgi:hypothetical protein